MSETAGFGTSWLPASVQRRIAVEEQAERREARDAERAREARAEAAGDKALAAYRQQAEGRGEVLSAMALAAGEGIGRSIEAVLGDAMAAADREDARQRSRDRREDVCFIDAEPVIAGASRSAWPESEWELNRMLRQADELHHDLVMTQTRQASRAGRSAEHLEAERAKANHAHGHDLHRGRYLPTPACDRCGYIECQCPNPGIIVR
jgi:hypothetical protein